MGTLTGTAAFTAAGASGTYTNRNTPFYEYDLTTPTPGQTLTYTASSTTFDPLVQVLSVTGTTSQLLTSNDDVTPGSNTNSAVAFQVQPGVQYKVRISSLNGAPAGAAFTGTLTDPGVATPANPVFVAAGSTTIGDTTQESITFPFIIAPAATADPNNLPANVATTEADAAVGAVFYNLSDSDDNLQLFLRPAATGLSVRGLNGNDNITGSAANDFINGNRGNDTLVGGDGQDFLRGGKDSDSIDGGIGNDIVNGNNENDTVLGGDGNDSVNGGQGNDLLIGGNGLDTLTGDFGQDSLVGGADADLFVLRADDTSAFNTTGLSHTSTKANEVDIIADFVLGTDKIGLNSSLTPADLVFEPIRVAPNGGASVPATALKISKSGFAADGKYLGVVLNVAAGDLKATTNFQLL